MLDESEYLYIKNAERALLCVFGALNLNSISVDSDNSIFS